MYDVHYVLICTMNLNALTGGSPESRRLAQLQILYNARGRKIEELDRDLKEVQDDSDREIRILKHKLALAQGKQTNYSF